MARVLISIACLCENYCARSDERAADVERNGGADMPAACPLAGFGALVVAGVIAFSGAVVGGV